MAGKGEEDRMPCEASSISEREMLGKGSSNGCVGGQKNPNGENRRIRTLDTSGEADRGQASKLALLTRGCRIPGGLGASLPAHVRAS
eukprot:6173976-Pleurochrysis_carterae.AAC.7